MTKTRYGLTVGMTQDQVDLIADNVAGDAPTQDKLGAVASGLLCDLADGGIMIPPAYAERIRDVSGQLDAVDITERVERSAGRFGESTVVEWIPDPSQVGYYQALADNQGLTLKQQLKAILDYAIEQGWLGSGAPDPWKILLTKEQYEWLAEVLGKEDPTGEDVVQFIEEHSGRAAFVQSAAAEELVGDIFKD